MRKASWKPPTAPGVGTATPTTSSAMIRNEPVKGIVIWKASVTSQMPAAIDSQSGSERASAWASRTGSRMTARPWHEDLAREPAAEPGRQEPQAGVRPTVRSARAGRRRPSTTSTSAGTERRRPGRRPSPSGRSRVDAAIPGRRRRRTAPKSSSTVTRSSSRSRIMVANVAVTLSPSRRASRYGRTHFADARGSTVLAAKPITVVRNACEKRVGPIGCSRYCQRSARST